MKKNGVVKEAIVLQRAVRIASCDFKPGKKRWLVHCSVKNAAVLCENIVKDSRKFELARLKKKKKKKEKHFGHDFLVRYFCDAF